MITQVPHPVSLEPPNHRKHYTDPLFSKHQVDLKPMATYITNYIHERLSLPRFKELCDYDMHDLREHV